MKDSFYFPHDYSSRNDQKILELRAEFGMEGYGLFWCFLETMAESGEDSINRAAIGGLSLGYSYPKAKLLKILDFCIKVGLFEEENGRVFSSRMTEHKNMRRELSDAGKKGAALRWKNRGANGEATGDPNAKERRGKKRKGGNAHAKNFNAPTKDEVIKYFRNSGYSDDAANRAYEGYAVANWHDSRGSKILDWKQKMIHVWFKPEHKVARKKAKAHKEEGEEEKQLTPEEKAARAQMVEALRNKVKTF